MAPLIQNFIALTSPLARRRRDVVRALGLGTPPVPMPPALPTTYVMQLFIAPDGV
jgi:hypothetical protein